MEAGSRPMSAPPLPLEDILGHAEVQKVQEVPGSRAFCTFCTFCIGSEKQRVDLPSML